MTEVGCCYGVSTAAILDGMWGSGGRLRLIEPKPQESLRTMLQVHSALRSQTLNLHPFTRIVESESLAKDAASGLPAIVCGLDESSILVLDGDHSSENVKAELDAVFAACVPRAIVFHDCGMGGGGLPGPVWGVGYAKYHLSGGTMIDDTPRPGMRTERGLGIVCRDPADHAIAEEIRCARC